MPSVLSLTASVNSVNVMMLVTNVNTIPIYVASHCENISQNYRKSLASANKKLYENSQLKTRTTFRPIDNTTYMENKGFMTDSETYLHK